MTWGLYGWFVEDGAEHIHPDYLDKFLKLAPYGKVFQCIEQDHEYLTIQYATETFKVKPTLYRKVHNPKYSFGTIVKLVAKPTVVGTIGEINWHFNHENHMYFLSINGQRKGTRYLANELAEFQ